MRCKACDVRLSETGDLELCDACLETIKPNFELPYTPVPLDPGEDEDAEV